MYANLAVGIRCKAADPPGHFPEEVYAHAVDIRDGVAVIGLDGNDGDGNYAEPAGEQRVDLSKFEISICAAI